ncbi:Lrp/AsnC family transcriptional regulator [Paracoccus sp. (in: a-proteobacteria)]|uniref:Lrp/AsnC family transcriptional regulator n=1 Tax=Paracoccus sp. TaxID=267 RepID=UPI0026DEC365|nr:Lrp/AsnC family transcriptional regulator [Paracoccus sp. (in: a-proteobacteria)]MDO5371122.1 Lrp/AsnC family transcriptional regulator [Paracoccus sp. (in: a-proteobacteria)]
MITADLIHYRIAAALMRGAAQPIGRIAQHVGLSRTACWKGIHKLEATGVLPGRVALAVSRLGVALACPSSQASSRPTIRADGARASKRRWPPW